MQNFRTLGQPLLGKKYVTRKEEKKKIVTLRSTARPKGSAHTSLGPILCILKNLLGGGGKGGGTRAEGGGCGYGVKINF